MCVNANGIRVSRNINPYESEYPKITNPVKVRSIEFLRPNRLLYASDLNSDLRGGDC